MTEYWKLNRSVNEVVSSQSATVTNARKLSFS